MTIQYTPTELINKITQNNYSYTNSYVKKMTETDTNVENLQEKSESFKNKVKALKRYSSGSISRELLSTQVEDLVKSYNDLKSSSDKVTDKDVQKQIAKLEKLFSDNEKSLKKIGIEKVNGKYTFDSDTFEDAAAKYVDPLLIGHDSLIGQADKIMRKVEETADDALYNVTEHKLSKTLKYQDTDMELADSYITLAGNTTSAIKSSNSFVQSGNMSDTALQQSITALLTKFAQSVYRPDAASENENINKLNQLCIDNEDKLAKVGLSFDKDQKSMTFNDKTDMTTNEFKTAFNELFGPNALFGNTVSAYCKDIFNDILQPEKLGVSILDEFA